MKMDLLLLFIGSAEIMNGVVQELVAVVDP